MQLLDLIQPVYAKYEAKNDPHCKSSENDLANKLKT